MRHRRIIALACALLLGALLAAPAVGRNDPAPRSLPLPTGLRFIDARAGNSSTAYVWTSTYVTSRPVRDMARYKALLKRRGFDVTGGPGINLSFPFKRWHVFACAESGCSAPKGRFTITVGIPGG